MDILFIVKSVESCARQMVISIPLVLFTIEPRMDIIFLSMQSNLFKHMSFG